MKTNSFPVELPIVATGADASPPVDIGSGFHGFMIQFMNVTAAPGVQYALEGSLDGETWFDITHGLRDVGNGGAAVAPPITADSIYDYPSRFPGQIHVVCKHVPNATPTDNPSAVVGYQDSRQT